MTTNALADLRTALDKVEALIAMTNTIADLRAALDKAEDEIIRLQEQLDAVVERLGEIAELVKAAKGFGPVLEKARKRAAEKVESNPAPEEPEQT